jgi:hypothetical protein
MLFSNAINLDRGLFLSPLERPTQGKPLSDHMSKMLKFQDEVMTKARTILSDSDSLHNAFKSNIIPTAYKPGTYVLVKYRKSINLYPASPRLHTYWKGPLEVISNKLSEYLLLDLITDKKEPYYVYDMRPFNYDPLLTNPLDIPRKDYLEFYIEKILDMAGDPKKCSTLDFLIKCVGYDDTYNLWLPFSEIRETDVLHSYLRENNLNRLVPRKIRLPVLHL